MVLVLLSMMRWHFQTSLLLYDSKKVSTMSNCANNAQSLNPAIVAHNLMKAVGK